MKQYLIDVSTLDYPKCKSSSKDKYLDIKE